MGIRQTRHLTHTCTIYRATPSTNAGGLRTEGSYAAVASGVACRYYYTSNVGDPSEVARLERMNMDTLDQVHFVAAQDVQEGDYLKDTTSGSPNLGQVHKVQGAPQRLTGGGLRTPNKAIVLAMPEQHPPELP
jgi:hypothetical protein